jgi:phosphopantetheinyl transferase (holo-ACP synthase)
MEKFREFLEVLLNKKIQNDETIKLSSAQTARVAMWADKNKYMLNFSQIRSSFTISSLSLSGLNTTENEIQSNKFNFKQKLDISRLGNDIQLIEELFPDDESLTSVHLEKLFTKYEITHAKSTANEKMTLAGLFSLKESLIKAGASHSTYLDLEITHDKYGAPIYYGFLVSISHSGKYATSVALKMI